VKVQALCDLSGHVAVVTGAGSGLDRVIAEAMAEAGVEVVRAAVDVAANTAIARVIRDLAQDDVAVRCDETNERDVTAVFEAAVERFGRVDIAFANAGIAGPAPSLLQEDYPSAIWDKEISMNLTGVFYTAARLLK